ncbi:MAG TPA: hypothetical protein ENN25_03250 [Euryarchaeota archaeon]|nr:hypothetical protein [Euryarchaeota archaeon]
MPTEQIKIDYKLLAEINKRYSTFPQDQWERIADGFYKITEIGKKPDVSIQYLSDQVARMLYRLFEFKEIGIVFKNEKDGLFRYATLLGYRKEAEAENRKLVYSEEDFMNEEKFPHAKMGRSSEFHVAEYIHHEGGDIAKAYNRPIELSAQRKSAEDFLEGDYIDVDIRGNNNELLGWFELSNTKDRKLPTRSTIIWVELFASLVGMIYLKMRK